MMRYLMLGILAILLPAASPPAEAQQAVRIGFQKSSTLITVLKAQGRLEEKLAKLGVKIQWAEFMSGPPLLEALNAGGIDLTADVADTVPVFAQAAGAQLVYFAQEAPSPTAQGVLVPANSPIDNVGGLKGKKVAITKGTGSHYLLIAALAQEGLTFKDITPVYLSPADGRAAFERGSVDAWATWDPFLAAGQHQTGARLLTDGSGIAPYQRYYLASTGFAASRPDVLHAIYTELDETGKWVKANPKEAAALLAPIWGLDLAIIERANSRRSYDVRPMVAGYLAGQQSIADTFFKEGLLPKPVEAANAGVWEPSL